MSNIEKIKLLKKILHYQKTFGMLTLFVHYLQAKSKKEFDIFLWGVFTSNMVFHLIVKLAEARHSSVYPMSIVFFAEKPNLRKQKTI